MSDGKRRKMGSNGRRGKAPLLTPRQLAVYRAIIDYRRERGVSPAMRELAEDMGCSVTAVHEHIDKLRHKGLLLDRKEHGARAVIPVDETRNGTCPWCGHHARPRDQHTEVSA